MSATEATRAPNVARPVEPVARPPMSRLERKSKQIQEAARRADSMPGLVATASFIRRLLPGDGHNGAATSTTGGRLPQHFGRLVTGLRPEGPSAVRELGLGALQTWQALSEAQGRGRGTVDVSILFTDLVGFSTWALVAGDDEALGLLREVWSVEERTISDGEGVVVKWLGDGSMAVFSDPESAVNAALDTRRRLARISADGYTPELRAGVHVGRPRKVGRDYLGVDINIAARVGDAAKPGEVVVSEDAREVLDPSAFVFGHKRRLKAAGVPRGLVISPVKDSTRGSFRNRG